MNQSEIFFSGFLDGTYEANVKIKNPNYKAIKHLKWNYFQKNEEIYSIKIVFDNKDHRYNAELVEILQPEEEINIKLILIPLVEFKGKILVEFSTNEEIKSQLQIIINLISRRPYLVCDPNLLEFKALFNETKFLEFKVKNSGTLEAKNLSFKLKNSNIKRIKLSLNSTFIKVNEEKAIIVTVRNSPDDTEGFYYETIVISNDFLNVQVGIKYFLSSSYEVELIVLAQDELSYFAEGKPLLANATITISNPIKRISRTLITNATGIATFSNLTETYYEVAAAANKHSPKRVIWQPKSNRNYLSIFLERITVIITWSVIPIFYEDRYEIKLESTFETYVPAPVIVVEPLYIKINDFDDPIKDHFLIKVTNHGLIRAENFTINLPSVFQNYKFEFDQEFEQFDLNGNTSVTI